MFKNFIPPKVQPGQEEYIKSIRENCITLCTGLAGTGKTFLALSEAMDMVMRSNKRGGIQRIVIVRPYVASNTGEKPGALPGTLDEKVLPYVQSIKDNLRQLGLNDQEIQQTLMQKFEFTILSMCRGRSFNNCFVIVEEAQNVPLNGDAMKMLLTRIGKHSKLVIQGDLDQMDISSDNSALPSTINILRDVPNVGIVSMDSIDCIQRSQIVKDVLLAYKKHEDNGWHTED